MKPREDWRAAARGIGLSVAVYLGIFFLIVFSAELAEGIRRGLDLCWRLLIPSTFLFLAVSNFLTSTPAGDWIARPFAPLSRLLRIPRPAMTIVVLSLVGGYPVGAKLLTDAVRRGALPARTADRMLAFCVNCGPAFLITGIGVGIFRNLSSGVVIYLSQIIACLAVGCLSGIGKAADPWNAPRTGTASGPPSPSRTLVCSVNEATRTMATICAFVTAFSALLSAASLPLSRLPGDAGRLVFGLLEVTAGCSGLPELTACNPLLAAVVFTAFGGICVILQICAILHGSGISLRTFLLWRIPYTLISLGVSELLFCCLPGTVPALSANHALSCGWYSVSPAATIFLAFLCIMLLFFSRKSDKIKRKADFPRTRGGLT